MVVTNQHVTFTLGETQTEKVYTRCESGMRRASPEFPFRIFRIISITRHRRGGTTVRMVDENTVYDTAKGLIVPAHVDTWTFTGEAYRAYGFYNVS